MSISIDRVQAEHHREAIGVGESAPRISWRFTGDAQNWIQSAYDIEITDSDTGLSKTYSYKSPDSLLLPWPGRPLQSGKSASIRVLAFGEGSSPATAWSESIFVEAGLLERSDWSDSKLITSAQDAEPNAARIPILLRRTFVTQSQVKKARLYVTAQGVYEAHINGQRVGDHVLAPGWTSYNHHLVYQTYDITHLIHTGQNVIAAQVAEGWYCGRLGFLGGKRNIWGNTMGLIAKLVLTGTDGDVTVIGTDSDWVSSTGALLTSELYDGETCDLRLEPSGWLNAYFDDKSWKRVETLPLPESDLVAPDGAPVKKIEEVKAISAFKSPSGKTIVDFGQNLVGWVRVRLQGPSGHVMKFLYIEVLENGEGATRPLRDCKATDTVTLSGEDQWWEPKFTFHGFRYVQVDGCPTDRDFDLTSIKAIVVHTDMEETGWFKCSNPLLNQLHRMFRRFQSLYYNLTLYRKYTLGYQRQLCLHSYRLPSAG